jgi:uncharacterized phosphosugar-binding protein
MIQKALDYAHSMRTVLNTIVEQEMGNILQAADVIANAVAQDGILYTFGTGHSHVIAEDVAYRAGGLVPVDAILEAALTGHEKVRQSEFMERVEGVSKVILDYYNPTSKDAIVIISNSGRNAAPVEMAQYARQRGMPVIAITSLAHSMGTTSRVSSGKKLYELAQIVIDNHCIKGDAMIHMEGLPMPVGAGSGVAGLFILHTIIVQTIQTLIDRGLKPPVFMSGNLDGADLVNVPLRERYKGRVKIW